MDRSTNADVTTDESFGDVLAKHRFIQRVFLILGCQLAVTAAIVCLLTTNEECKAWIRERPWLVASAALLFVVTYFIILCRCCPLCMESDGARWIVLGAFTLSKALLIGVLASHYRVEGVMQALVATVLIVFILSLFATQTSIDFTSCGTMICLTTLATMIIAAVAVATSASKESQERAMIFYCCCGAAVFCIYLIYDIQLIVGGDHPRANELSPDSYILGAVLLYVDIVQLFLYVLRLIGEEE